jgi:putative acetyltransferase
MIAVHSAIMAGWTLRPLGPDDVRALAELARQPAELEVAEHGSEEPGAWFAGLIGDGSPDLGGAIAAFDGERMIAAVAMRRSPRPRTHHVARLRLYGGSAITRDALAACVDRAVEIADRWSNVIRCEARVAAGDVRGEAILVPRGFVPESTVTAALRIGDRLVDERVLGRLRPGWAPPRPIAAAPAEVPARRACRGEVRVRPMTSDDSEAMHALMTETSVVWGTLQTPLQSADHWRRILSGNDSNRDVTACVEVDGVYAGNVSLITGRVSGRAHVRGLGMSVRPEYQGMGLGGVLVDHVLARALDLGILRVELEVYPDNERALRLYESRGFVHEGIRRAAAYRDGTIVDNLMMARVTRGRTAA